MNRARALLARAQGTKPWRAWSRYGTARGNVLAGGIAYFAFLSLVPVLAIGFTVLGLVLRGSQSLQQQLVDYLNDTLGTKLLGMTAADGAQITIGTLIQPAVLNISVAVGLVALLVTGLGWIDALRQGIRAVFGLPDQGNPVVIKLVDVGVLALLGLGVLTSAAATVVINSASSRVLGWLGIGGSTVSQVIVQVLVDAALIAFDAALLLLVTRLLAAIAVPALDLAGGALLGAFGLFVLKLAGALGLKLVSGNKVLAGASVVVGLLVWFDFAARIVLVSAAWSATTVDDRRPAEPLAEPVPQGQTPGEQTRASGDLSALPDHGQRAADRVTVLAGAVLGAVAVTGVALVGRAARTLSGAIRHPGRPGA